MVKKLAVCGIFGLLVLVLSACYGPKTTEADQALVQTKSGEVQEVKIGGGRHWSMQPYVEGTIIGLGIREATFVTDSENGKAWTSDSQPIIVTVSVEYRVISTEENIKWLWSNKKAILTSDDAKYEAVRTRLISELKEVSVHYTLQEMVGLEAGSGREQVVAELSSELAPELEAIGLELISLRIVNVDPADDEYEALLNEAAKAKAREQAAQQNLAVKRKEQEAARIDNEILVERAETDAQVREINAEVYENDRAFQLELARIMSEAINAGDVVLFVPEGQDITYIINGKTGEIVPIQ